MEPATPTLVFVANADILLRFFGLAAVCFALPVFAMRFGKEWLIALLPVYLVTANVFAKSFFVLCMVGEVPILMNLAIPIYAACFLVTDLLSEFYLKSDAVRAVWTGLLGQGVFLIAVIIILNASFDGVEEYRNALGNLPRLVIGSFIAYILSNQLDIRLYHLIMKLTARKHLWMRNNLSTLVSQAVDTTLFLAIAFWGVSPVETPTKWVVFAIATWLFKTLVAALDTFAIYGARRLYRPQNAR